MKASTSRTILVTPQLAAMWLENCSYRGQRALRSAHVRYLAQVMADGHFMPGTAIHFAVQKDLGEEFLINGQHTLSAIVQSGVPQQLTAVYLCTENSTETASAYSSIDINARRTTADALSAMMIADEVGLSNTSINQLAAAIKVIESGFGRQKKHVQIQIDDMVHLIHTYSESMKKYLSATEFTQKHMLSSRFRAATVSVALVTYRFSSTVYSIGRIDSFWTQALLDDGLGITDPRKHAYRHLSSSGMKDGGRGVTTLESVSVNSSCRTLAHCFNSYMENREMRMLRLPESMHINGSPY